LPASQSGASGCAPCSARRTGGLAVGVPSRAIQSGTSGSADVGAGSEGSPPSRAARSNTGEIVCAPCVAGSLPKSRSQSGTLSSARGWTSGCSVGSVPRKRLNQSSDSPGAAGCAGGGVGVDGVGRAGAAGPAAGCSPLGFVGKDSPFLTTVVSEGFGSGLAAVIGTTRAPHESQKTLPGGFIFPHIGQRTPAAEGSAAPHSLQNRLASRLAAPQLSQRIISHSMGGPPQ
jgi:hypothetical protein